MPQQNPRLRFSRTRFAFTNFLMAVVSIAFLCRSGWFLGMWQSLKENV